MKRFPYILCIVFPVFVWACHTSRQTIGEARENRVLLIAIYMSSLIRCVGMNGRGLPNGNGHMSMCSIPYGTKLSILPFRLLV